MNFAIMDRISILTPPGVGAIACLGVGGPKAWETIRRFFRLQGKQPLPDSPPLHRFWFGTLGHADAPGDEVILSAKPDGFEIHCHGGRRVVRWIMGLFLGEGFAEVPSHNSNVETPWDLLTRASTTRTAAILLDQYHGAFRQAAEIILNDLPASSTALKRLLELAPIGRHLVEPWKVVIAGPPNVGKSSLLNALAGYARSIVAPVMGTTRDVVTASVAFDGWPVELSDTAGLHEAQDALEAAGIEKAIEEIADADLVVWVKDATEGRPADASSEIPAERLLVVWNKCDVAAGLDVPKELRVSATAYTGVPELIVAIVARLIPRAPLPLEAVPYSPSLASAVEMAWQQFALGNLDAAGAFLKSCIAEAS